MTYIRTIFLVLLLIPVAFANDAQLIRDMESLRDSLPFKDPGRPALTRRLADLCFQKAVQDDKDLILSGKGQASEVTALRAKAIKLYTEALDGEKGTYPAAQGELKNKIEFQVARLERMQGQKAKALSTFKTLAALPNVNKDLLRETLLTIAEMHDEEGQWVEAQAAYQKALPHCQGADAISYVRYRLAWAYFRKNQISEAQTEMSQALYDAQGNLKDQAMADYLQFLAATPGDMGSQHLMKVEGIAAKARRPEFVEQLADAYFTAGNRQAGVTVLAHAQRLRPSPFAAARLSEEYYGFKRLDDMQAMLTYLKGQAAGVKALEDKKREAVDQILRRLVVQLDGERKSNPGQFNAEVMLAIETHLALFPQSDVTEKMRAGWLVASTDDAAKMERLSLWIKAETNIDAQRRYRQERAALALKTKNTQVVREEARELLKTTDEASAREWTYVEAKAAYDMGEEAHALSAFQALAKKTQSPDKWAVQSQHLALDILNKGKRYQELVQQASLWTNQAALKNSAVAADVLEMDKARSEASFEYAASLGETEAALTEFNRFCQEGQFVEKSCPNAKVLAVKLKNQAVLVQVLARMNDKPALAQEYERMGRFEDAAAILEPALTAQQPEVEWIKVSLMYQIAGNEAARARVLRKLSARLIKLGKMSAELEGVVIAAYHHSEIKGAELMRLPWSAAQKIRLATELETQGLGDAQTKKLISSSKEDLGAVWAREVFSRMNALDQRQRQITFYTGNTSARVQQRMTSMGNYAKEVKAVLDGASTPVRVALLNSLAKAYGDLDKEILATPLPAGITAEQLAGAKEAMESLAQPMRIEAESYQKLAAEQQATLADAASWPFAEGTAAVLARIETEERANAPKAAAGMTPTERSTVLSSLAVDPNSRSALERLRDDFKTRGDLAAAAYFTGRLSAMEQL